jgi:urease accessory protein
MSQEGQSPVCQFSDRLTTALNAATGAEGHSHSHDGGASHTHGHGEHGAWTPDEHGHTHEHLENAGKFSERDLPDYSGRDWSERAFTIGIGG